MGIVCVDDKFSKPFKTYLGKVAVYNFVMKVMKNILSKNL